MCDYDDLDRLSSAQNSASQGPVAGTDLLWDYDPTGNRTSQTNAGTPLSYSIDPNSNRLLQVGANARQYDEVGNTVNDGNGITSTYSPRNRLVQTSNAGLSTTYAHNGFGERVCKAIDSSQACASSTGRIEYVYDDSGHLIGEYPVGGSTAQAVEYVWLDDTPIAVLQRRPGSTNGGASGGGTATAWNGTQAGGVDVYYLHPDHLDTPRVVVNAQDQEIWRWDASPFGDTLADEQPTGGLPSYTQNLRFPGQQYDRETGAHYNYFRDYEAGTGRYLQSDPIGIWADYSAFNYVASRPNKYADPTGLSLTITSLGGHGSKRFPNVPAPCKKGSRNSEKGAAGESQMAAFASSMGYEIIGGGPASAITPPSTGATVHPDLVVRDPTTGKRYLLDSKCGNCAGFTRNQRKSYREIARNPKLSGYDDVIIFKWRYRR